MSEEINPSVSGTPGIPSTPQWSRRGLIAAIAAALIIVAGFLWSRSPRPPATASPDVSSPAAPPPGSGPPVSTPPPSPKGTVSATMTVVNLTPAAQIQAEKFRCVCGCRLSLGECYCSKTPGSGEMKRFLQGLVDKGLTPADIEKGMVEKYGRSVAP